MTTGEGEGVERVWNFELSMEVTSKQLEDGDSPKSFCVKAGNMSGMASKGLFNKTEKQHNILKNGSTVRANHPTKSNVFLHFRGLWDK